MGILAILVGLPVLAAQSPEAWRWGFVAIGPSQFHQWPDHVTHPGNQLGGRLSRSYATSITDETARRYTFKWGDLPMLARIRSWWWLGMKEVLEAISILVFFRWFFPLV